VGQNYLLADTREHPRLRLQLERQWDEQEVRPRRAALRQEHFARPLYWLRKLATALQARALPKSRLGQACAYLLCHWEPLPTRLAHPAAGHDQPE